MPRPNDVRTGSPPHAGGLPCFLGQDDDASNEPMNFCGPPHNGKPSNHGQQFAQVLSHPHHHTCSDEQQANAPTELVPHPNVLLDIPVGSLTFDVRHGTIRVRFAHSAACVDWRLCVIGGEAVLAGGSRPPTACRALCVCSSISHGHPPRPWTPSLALTHAAGHGDSSGFP